MPKFFTRSAVVVTSAVALSSVGVAYAAWTTAGSASTVASSAKARGSLSVSPAALVAESIYPTATFTNVVTVANSNPYAVKLSGVTVTDANSSVAACDTALAALETAKTPAFTGTKADTTRLTAANGTVDIPVPVTVTNDLPDECVGAAITVVFSANGASSN